MSDVVKMETVKPTDPIEDKLDQILSLLSEELNIHPDSVRNGAFDAGHPVRLGTNHSNPPLFVNWWADTNDTGTYITLQLKDWTGQPIFYKHFKCVYRDQSTGVVVDKQTDIR